MSARTTPTHKRCPNCDGVKDASEFYACRSTHDGLSGYCQDCSRERSAHWQESMTPDQREARRTRERERARSRASDPAYRETKRQWYEANRLRVRGQGLVARYGITLQDYESMLASQGGGCAICLTPPPPERPLHVDHCHKTGRVRGLLCQSCNTSLGKFGDDPEVLRRALSYLEGK